MFLWLKENGTRVRTVAVGEVQEKVTKQGQREVHTCQLSYFSRMTDAITFGELAEVEMQRRGVTQAKAVCAVTDGADWIQGFIDLHRPAALRILDFPHAAEHLNHFLHLKGHTREEKQCYDPLIIGDATETCTRHGHSRL